MSSRSRMLLLSAILIFDVRPANAVVFALYLDPGTASMALQMIMAAVLGSIVVAKLMWKRIVGFFTGESLETDSPSAGDESTPPDEDPEI